MNAKQLIRRNLRLGVSATPARYDQNTRATPNGISGASDYLQTIERADRSTLAADGNQVHADQLRSMATLKVLDFGDAPGCPTRKL